MARPQAGDRVAGVPMVALVILRARRVDTVPLSLIRSRPTDAAALSAAWVPGGAPPPGVECDRGRAMMAAAPGTRRCIIVARCGRCGRGRLADAVTGRPAGSTLALRPAADRSAALAGIGRRGPRALGQPTVCPRGPMDSGRPASVPEAGR